MRVGIVAGVVVEHDAISAAVVNQAALLSSLPAVDEVIVYAQHIDRADVPCRSAIIGDPWQLLRQLEQDRIDRVIAHWGIHYSVFDVLTLLPDSDVRGVVHFHNCTPPSLVSPPDRPVIERSIAQISHVISLGTPMWTFSDFNESTLREWGAADHQIRFVPFPVALPDAVGRTPIGASEQLELIVVGRLVPAKGVVVVLEALEQLSAERRRSVHLRIVSSVTFSDPGYRDEVIDRVTRLGPTTAELIEAPSDESLWDLYRAADVLIAPSFHEGLCVPVIEAYHFGCRVIASDAGNLPFIVVDDDEVLPVGDATELAAAIDRAVAAGKKQTMSASGARAAVVDRYSPPSARRRHFEQL